MTKHEDHNEPPRQLSEGVHQEDVYVQEERIETPSSILVNDIIIL